jgi:TRAP-type C4-dicarboxylate transport system substrate-binding protein
MSLSDEDKQWIQELMQGQMQGQRQYVQEQMQGQREYVHEQMGLMREQLEVVETRLLTEFHKWASPFEARQRTHTAALRAIDLEMEELSDRVKKLEG